MGNKKSAVGLLPTTSASLKLYRNLEAFETLSSEHTRRESHLCRVGQQVFLFGLKVVFHLSCVFFFPAWKKSTYGGCAAQILSTEKSIMPWQRVSCLGEVCFPVPTCVPHMAGL